MILLEKWPLDTGGRKIQYKPWLERPPTLTKRGPDFNFKIYWHE